MRRYPGQAVRVFPNRTAFTLVEIIVAVAIISILLAMLLPALASAFRTAREARVLARMDAMAASITDFKREFGITPPSSVTLFAPAPGSTNPLGTWTDGRSIGLIRRIWPEFDFRQSGGLAASAFGGQPSVTLDGSECLVFFLGGIRESTTGPLTGFSKNAKLPFSTGGSRQGPYFEFDTALLVDVVPTTGNGIPEYLGPLPSASVPLAYFSSYDGAGYRPADNDGVDGVLTPASPSPIPYYQDSGKQTAWKRDSFQIISPGSDNTFGVGGWFDPEDDACTADALTRNANSLHEYDNLVNFHGRRLFD